MYLFLDLETTGIKPESVALELGAVLLDDDRREVGRFDALIVGDGRYRDAVASDGGPFVTNMHERSGLFSDLDEGQAACMGMASIDEACAHMERALHLDRYKGRLILGGYSVQFDRVHLPAWFVATLHHRQIDVSTLRQSWKIAGRPVPDQKGAHRTLADCDAAIAEWMHYLDEIRQCTA